jgi:hypothetical protein
MTPAMMNQSLLRRVSENIKYFYLNISIGSIVLPIKMGLCMSSNPKPVEPYQVYAYDNIGRRGDHWYPNELRPIQKGVYIIDSQNNVFNTRGHPSRCSEFCYVKPEVRVRIHNVGMGMHTFKREDLVSVYETLICHNIDDECEYLIKLTDITAHLTPYMFSRNALFEVPRGVMDKSKRQFVRNMLYSGVPAIKQASLDLLSDDSMFEQFHFGYYRKHELDQLTYYMKQEVKEIEDTIPKIPFFKRAHLPHVYNNIMSFVTFMVPKKYHD